MVAAIFSVMYASIVLTVVTMLVLLSLYHLQYALLVQYCTRAQYVIRNDPSRGYYDGVASEYLSTIAIGYVN
jgi:hypothetical protein